VKYDNFFTVRKTEVQQFVSWWNCTYGDALPEDCETVEALDQEVLNRIVNWPAHGDPALGQDYYLAPFYDNPDAPAGANGFYDPINDGDYPWYDLNDEVDCRNDRRVTLFGDETNWWVFNDKGNIHTETGGDPIGMEIRAQAFSFATNDVINDMSFYNYELINRGTQTLFNTYFAQYVDADIGGAFDDYVGCDVARGLGFAYNGDAVDETGAQNWGENPPAVGVDFFEGPYQDADDLDNPLTTNIQDAIDSLGIPYKGLGIGYGDGVVDNERLGMRRFIYYNSSGSQIQTDPENANQYYGYMKGEWGVSGSTHSYGGTGLGGSILANYMYPGDSDPLFWGTSGIETPIWSEESEGNPPADRRFAQVAGPFTLRPGAVNNLTVGIVFGRSFDGDVLASVRAMKVADTKAQALFDACFEIVEPPLAPVLTIQEMENQLILFLDDPNGTIETYEQKDELNIPEFDADGNPNDQSYRFQGYQIFQMIDEEASVSDIADITKSRLVAQCDIEDGVTKLINYVYNEADEIDDASVMVNGADEGIQHSFHVTEDLFASGDRTLINHKKYYFIAVAYGYNEFKAYDPNDAAFTDGQKTPYLVSRQSVAGGSIESAIGIPHNPVSEAEGTTFGTVYGWTPEIEQVDGLGNGGNFVKLTQTTEDLILANGFVNNPIYQNGAGPVNIKVVDPLNVKEGTYTLAFESDAPTKRKGIVDSTEWVLTRTFEGVSVSVSSKNTIGESNEQIIPEWGLSVQIEQIYYTDADGGEVTGAPDSYFTSPIDVTIEYADPTKEWLSQVTDNDANYPFNWIRSGGTEVDDPAATCSADMWTTNPCYYEDNNFDPNQEYEGLLDGGIAPFRLVGAGVYGMPLGAPGHTYSEELSYAGSRWTTISGTQSRANFVDQHDVDIVLTNDKDKWTKCVVFEMNDNENQTEGDADVMNLRDHASVDKDGNDIAGETGRGWFPGYAIDVTTGRRLNMAFAENSWLAGENGNDMIWNPTSRMVDNLGTPLFGGMHYVYVFGESNDMPRYDEGNWMYGLLNDNPGTAEFQDVFENCQWVWEPTLEENKVLLETDVRISMRINKPYAENEDIAGPNNGRPMYNFNIDAATAVGVGNTSVLDSALALINIVPNPYYAYNDYETGKLDTRVKITNLPEACTITIFNMQGALVRQFVKDDPLTSIDWDLKNHKGIPIAGGVYILHIDVPGVGERILKWYGALRAPDLDNL
jgi:hypothetical protein